MPLRNARSAIGANFHNTVSPSDPTRNHICVIGGGAAGAAFLKESLHRAANSDLSDAVSYTIIDERPYAELGRGTAWSSSQSDWLLANMRIHTMGFSNDVARELAKSLPIGSDSDHPHLLSDKQLFVRRKAIGEVLHRDFHEKVEELAIARGTPFRHIQSSCVAIYEVGTGYLVETEDGQRHFAHDIVLALGNFLPSSYTHLKDQPGYFANPWLWEQYDTLSNKLKVGIIGLGPTAIDTILLLAKRDFKNIVSYSREGVIQYPRPRTRPHKAKFMDADYIRDIHKACGGLTFSQVESLVFQEFLYAGAVCDDMQKVFNLVKGKDPQFVLHYGLAEVEKESAWFAVLKSFDEVTPLIWSLLSEADRDVYLDKWRKVHTAVSYGMASVQAMRVLDLIHDKHLRIRSGIVNNIVRDEKLCRGIEPIAEGGFQIHYAKKEKKSGLNSVASEAVDIVVNCAGIGSDIEVCENVLVKYLFEQNFLVKHPRGGARVHFDTGQILDEGGLPQGSIYSLTGSLTFGTHLLTHCLGEVLKSSVQTARAIHASISARHQKRPNFVT